MQACACAPGSCSRCRPAVASGSGPLSPPEEPAQAWLASPDRAFQRDGVRDQRDHGRDGQVEDTRVALAGALHDRGRRRASHRQVPAAWHRVDPRNEVAEIVRLMHEPPPHEATHWTLQAMANIAGVGPRFRRSGRRTALRRTAGVPSSSRTTRRSRRSSPPSSASTSIRRRTPWSCRSTSRARSRRSTGPSRVYP